MASNNKLTAALVMAGRFEKNEGAERTLLDLCRRADCKADEEYWLVTALREALANAVRHGSGQDPDQDVRVFFAIENSTVTIRV